MARRQLKSVPPGYVLVYNTSGSSPGTARALARNVSADMVSMLAAILPYCAAREGPSSLPLQATLKAALCHLKRAGALTRYVHVARGHSERRSRWVFVGKPAASLNFRTVFVPACLQQRQGPAYVYRPGIC